MHRWVIVAVAAAILASSGAAFVFWPRAGLVGDDAALARVLLPGFAGRVTNIDVRTVDDRPIAIELRQGRIWPSHPLAQGQRLTVVLTVRRPGWAAWLVGQTDRRTFEVRTPSVTLLGRWLQVRSGAPVRVGFNTPVSLVSLNHRRAEKLAAPRTLVSVGVVARGAHQAGAVWVSAAARAWERLPTPVKVSWFPARPYPQLLVAPAEGAALAPGSPLTLTFSQPVSVVLGSTRPTLSPATPGRWSDPDAHTLVFTPNGLGFGLGETVRVRLPRAAHLTGQSGAALTRTLLWHVPPGSTLRLQQLLAQLGYLPLVWTSASGSEPNSERAELAVSITPPPGRFSWRYPNTPAELRALWRAGQPNEITRGAVMMFEQTHALAVDGFAGPHVWGALLADAVSGKHRVDGYSYVYVHRNIPQSLNLWHDGRVILRSPGNTGVAAAPTQLGTYPVFEHIPVGTMSGTNPGGSHYHDPGIRYISYFHGGDAIHAFNRASFGTPQSLGCVELPLAAAAKVWPYTPIGTLVTVEN